MFVLLVSGTRRQVSCGLVRIPFYPWLGHFVNDTILIPNVVQGETNFVCDTRPVEFLIIGHTGGFMF